MSESYVLLDGRRVMFVCVQDEAEGLWAARGVRWRRDEQETR
jgi:hypothetical protein